MTGVYAIFHFCLIEDARGWKLVTGTWMRVNTEE